MEIAVIITLAVAAIALSIGRLNDKATIRILTKQANDTKTAALVVVPDLAERVKATNAAASAKYSEAQEAEKQHHDLIKEAVKQQEIAEEAQEAADLLAAQAAIFEAALPEKE